MRLALSVRAYVGLTTFVGYAIIAVGLRDSLGSDHTTLALLCAAAILAERFQVEADPDGLHSSWVQTFSFSSGVHLAAAVLVGPTAAAVVAATGVIVSDSARGKRWYRVLFNAAVFAIASALGGVAFTLAGAEIGALNIPGDLAAMAALAGVYSLTNTVLVGAVVGLTTGDSIAHVVRASALGGLATDFAEAGLGGAVAIFAVSQPWAIVLLLPLALAAYRAHDRLELMRRETARALEAFANVVDERDASTYRHSERVAENVRELGEALGLPSDEVSRLRWAGRLHDLGKVAVDATVLRKPGALTEDEFATMKRHARLSARILSKFRFATAHALAVEHHHERFDGNGYYGVHPEELPLASHFLIVADSFDAMTSDRSYRAGMSVEAALAEIERGIGTQFHPGVARAFVALKRGQDPVAALEAVELAELRRPSLAADVLLPLRRAFVGWHEWVFVLAASAGLLNVALGLVVPAVFSFAVALVASVSRYVLESRARRLAAIFALRASGAEHDAQTFNALLEPVAAAGRLRWAALVRWSPQLLSGSLVCEWRPGSSSPAIHPITSWLLRHGDGRNSVVFEAGRKFGLDGEFVALRLPRVFAPPLYLVLAYKRRVPSHIQAALKIFDSAQPELEAETITAQVEPQPPVLRAVS